MRTTYFARVYRGTDMQRNETYNFASRVERDNFVAYCRERGFTVCAQGIDHLFTALQAIKNFEAL